MDVIYCSTSITQWMAVLSNAEDRKAVHTHTRDMHHENISDFNASYFSEYNLHCLWWYSSLLDAYPFMVYSSEPDAFWLTLLRIVSGPHNAEVPRKSKYFFGVCAV